MPKPYVNPKPKSLTSLEFLCRCFHLDHISMIERESTAVGLAEVLRPWTRHKSVFGICADNAANIQATSAVESFCRFVCSIDKAEVLKGVQKALKAKMIFPGAAKIILDVLV